MIRHNKAAFFSATALTFALSALCTAQTSDEIPNLSWGYVRVDLAGSRDFDGLTSEFEPAQLVDEFIRPESLRRRPELEELERSETGALIVTDGNCNGPSGIEPNSAGFWYAQTRDEILIIGENAAPNARTAALRRVYMDGRSHPDASRWMPRAAGHSIGWYENGELVVETMGMTTGNVTAGGYRTPETKLIERFRLSPDERMLTITYTWEDPKIYARPHTYSLHFERVPDDAYALESWCDSGDPSYSYSVAPPEQD